MIKKIYTIIFITFIANNINGQLAPEVFVAYFNTKKGTPYELSAPNKFLTEKAIERRTKNGIAIDSLDLPVNSIFVDSLKSVVHKVLYTSKWFNFAVFQGNWNEVELVEKFTFVDRVGEKQQGDTISKQTSRDKFDLAEFKPLLAEYPNYKQVQSQINLTPLHKMGYRGDGIRIAILDAGFTNFDKMEAFQHLFADNRIIATANFAEDTTVYYSHPHGTFVASIMCGELGTKYQGAARKAEYVLIRSETGSNEYLVEEYNWVAAAELADSLGVDIINTSLGYTTFDWSWQNHTYNDLDGETTIISRAAGIAAQKGILVVASAGNDGYAPWRYIGVPADHPNVLAVGSVDINGSLSGFSSVGYSFHEFKPDVVACGEYAPYISLNCVYNGNGTSYAAPLIASAAACLWQSFPEKNNFEVMNAIVKSTNKYTSPNNNIGYGLPDFLKAYFILNNSQYQPSNINQPEIVSVYANVDETIFVNVYTPHKVNATIKVFDIFGHQMYSHHILLEEKKVNNIEINSLGPGIDSQLLIVNVFGNQIKESKKFFVR